MNLIKIISIVPKLLDGRILIAHSFMSLRAQKGRRSLIEKRMRLLACSERIEGIFYAPRNDIGSSNFGRCQITGYNI